MTPSLWTGMYAEKSLAEALRILRALGWKTFEICFEHLVQIETSPQLQRELDEARRVADELKVCMPQAHALLKADVAHPDKECRKQDIERVHLHLGLAAQLGARQVVVHPGGGGGYTTRDERAAILKLNREGFQRLGDRAGELGLRIGIENMMDHRDRHGVRRFGSSPHELVEFIEEMNHTALGITLDTSHANVQHLDVPATVREFGAKLWCTHISDNDGSGDQHRTPGGGKMDWPAIVTALKSIGYEGEFNLEIPGERHADLGLRELHTRHALETVAYLLA